MSDNQTIFVSSDKNVRPPNRESIPEIILASTSPRRRQLLTQVNIPFIVIAPDAVERRPTNGDFGVVVENAELKARSVIERADGRLILGADTVADLDRRPLGKPTDSDDARRMLRILSGRSHRVHTGIALVDPVTNRTYSDHVITVVTFRTLAETEIEDYIRSGEPFDKAGSYGIQERGALFIEKVNGCFFNVMGLPLARFWELLMLLNVEKKNEKVFPS